MGTAGCCGNPSLERTESHAPQPSPPHTPFVRRLIQDSSAAAVQLLSQPMFSGKEMRLMRLLGTDQC